MDEEMLPVVGSKHRLEQLQGTIRGSLNQHFSSLIQGPSGALMA